MEAVGQDFEVIRLRKIQKFLNGGRFGMQCLLGPPDVILVASMKFGAHGFNWAGMKAICITG